KETDDLYFMRLDDLAWKNAGDEWLRLALLTGLSDNAWPFLQKAGPRWFHSRSAAPTDARTGARNRPTEPQAAALTGAHTHFVRAVAAIIGARYRPTEVQACCELLTGFRRSRGPQNVGGRSVGSLAVLAGLLEGVARTGKPLPDLANLKDLLDYARETALEAE